MTEMDIETSVYNVHLTRLIAREDFIKWKLSYATEVYHFPFSDIINTELCKLLQKHLELLLLLLKSDGDLNVFFVTLPILMLKKQNEMI